MSGEDAVVDTARGEAQKAWRAAMQVGEFLARRRQRLLARAEEHSRAATQAMRDTMEDERRLAQPVYSRALDKDWWDIVGPKDAATTYGVAKKFSTTDPQAALAARTCEKEAQERWGIDLTDQVEVGQEAATSDRVAAATALGEDRPTLVADQVDAELAAAAVAVSKEHVEAEDALTATNGHLTPGAQAEVDDETRAAATWDSLEARKAWEDQMEGAIHDHDAVRSAVTADKGLSQPPSQAITTTKQKTPVKRPKAAQTASRTRTQGI